MQEGDCGVGSTVGAWGVAGHANLGGMPDHVSQHDRVLRAVPADRQRAATWTALWRAGRDLAALAGQVRGAPVAPGHHIAEEAPTELARVTARLPAGRTASPAGASRLGPKRRQHLIGTGTTWDCSRDDIGTSES
jgi:hypothetical protein